jgi:hypothetical protein
MDCTAGETTLVLDYDGRFRACELRDPIGRIDEYDCDTQKIMHSDAMKNEIEAIGHGYKANCWCTHGCWISASLGYNPGKMIKKVFAGYNETKKFGKKHPVFVNEQMLKDIEAKYHLDTAQLAAIGLDKVIG